MNYMKDEYTCILCAEEWGFCPEDYFFDELAYPSICPFCNMPKTQLFHEVYREEGFIAAIKAVWKRTV
jgi:hypothetical protein